MHIFSVDALVGDPSRTITKMGGTAVFVSPAREQQSNSEQTGSNSVPFAIWEGTAGLWCCVEPVAVAKGAQGGWKEHSGGAHCLEAERGGLMLGGPRQRSWMDPALLWIKSNKLAVASFVTQRRHSGTVQWYHAVHKYKTAFTEYRESKNESWWVLCIILMCIVGFFKLVHCCLSECSFMSRKPLKWSLKLEEEKGKCWHRWDNVRCRDLNCHSNSLEWDGLLFQGSLDGQGEFLFFCPGERERGFREMW